MKLYEIKPLLQDMRVHGIKQDKFSFQYNDVIFDVLVLIERTPFELLFGVVDHNYSFSLKLQNGYVLDDLPNDVFFKLCDILHLKPGRDSLTSSKFLRYFASKIPTKSTGRKIQPHEIAIYKRSQISDSTSIYFKGWRHHETDGCVVRNLEKTKKLLGDEAYRFCKEHNISSCWGKNPSDRINYYPPNEYQKKR